MKAPLGFCPECGALTVTHLDGVCKCSANHEYPHFKIVWPQGDEPAAKSKDWLDTDADNPTPPDKSGMVVSMKAAEPAMQVEGKITPAPIAKPVGILTNASPLDFLVQAQKVYEEHEELKRKFAAMRKCLIDMVTEIDQLVVRDDIPKRKKPATPKK